jgi:hypothetical protein
MSLPTISQDCLSIAFLSNYCVASYPGYLAIGELNPSHGFNENQYIKIRSTDIEKFIISAKTILIFFGEKDLDSDTDVPILEKKSKYIIKWSGENRQYRNEARVKISVELFEEKKTFSIFFLFDEFYHLLESFINVAFNSFLLCAYQVACLKEFLNNLQTESRDLEYLKFLTHEDCLNFAKNLCNRLGIPSINTFLIGDKLYEHKVELMLFLDIRKLFACRTQMSPFYIFLGMD